MKRICSIVALLALVVLSTDAIAACLNCTNNKEFCLVTTSSNPTVTTQSTHILSFDGLNNGHVELYGKTCYLNPASEYTLEVYDCLPVNGAGILNDSKIEFFVNGAEYNDEAGFPAFTQGTFHVLLSLDTLKGTYATESIVSFEMADEEGESKRYRYEIFDEGTVTAVKCPRSTMSELAADAQFQALMNSLDRMGND